jgi:hypothetical protein
VISTPPIQKNKIVARGIRLSLGLLGLTGLLIDVRLHNLVEVRFVDHCTGFGALGLLLQILAKKVEVEFALLNLRASLQAIPER